MPQNASYTQAIAHRNGSLLLLARIVNWDNAAIQQADVASISYTVRLIDEDDEYTTTVVSGHDGVAIAVADAIYDTLQTDSVWSVDSTGYNFKHQLDVSSNQAFATRGRAYFVDVAITPVSGQVIRATWRVDVI
jgi:hypothetical protein